VLFGRYRLLSRAGAGGSAQVWRAEDEQTGEEVAVKRLHPVVFADPEAWCLTTMFETTGLGAPVWTASARAAAA